jgi:hypothetical protein
MLKLALQRVDALAKQTVYPFVKEKARAVDEFIDHARREKIRQVTLRPVCDCRQCTH